MRRFQIHIGQTLDIKTRASRVYWNFVICGANFNTALYLRVRSQQKQLCLSQLVNCGMSIVVAYLLHQDTKPGRSPDISGLCLPSIIKFIKIKTILFQSILWSKMKMFTYMYHTLLFCCWNGTELSRCQNNMAMESDIKPDKKLHGSSIIKM